MGRLTERELNVMDCASYTKCNTDECVGYCGGCNAEEEAKLKLKHYEDLEEQGLLLKLPCRTGDTIYDISTLQILSYKVESFKMIRNRVVSMRTSYIINDTLLFSRSYVDDIGKTVFLTKAEAEKALAEMEK